MSVFQKKRKLNNIEKRRNLLANIDELIDTAFKNKIYDHREILGEIRVKIQTMKISQLMYTNLTEIFDCFCNLACLNSKILDIFCERFEIEIVDKRKNNGLETKNINDIEFLRDQIFIEAVQIEREIEQCNKKINYHLDNVNKLEWRMVSDQRDTLVNSLILKENQINSISKKISILKSSETVNQSKSINDALQSSSFYVDVDLLADTLAEANSIYNEISNNYNIINEKLAGEKNNSYDFDRAYEKRLLERNKNEKNESNEILKSIETVEEAE